MVGMTSSIWSGVWVTGEGLIALPFDQLTQHHIHQGLWICTFPMSTITCIIKLHYASFIWVLTITMLGAVTCRFSAYSLGKVLQTPKLTMFLNLKVVITYIFVCASGSSWREICECLTSSGEVYLGGF